MKTARYSGQKRPSQSPSVTALPEGEPRRESQGGRAKGLHLPLPLGEVSERSEDGEGKQHPSQISFDKMQK